MLTMDTPNSSPSATPTPSASAAARPAVWDFVVIGAGMAGSATAWHLASSAQVLVLEQESQPGYHTTGRSAALFEEHYGPAQVQALTRASRAFYEQPPADFAEQALVSPRGVLYVATPEQLPALQAAYDEARQHSPGARWLDKTELKAFLPALNTEVLEAGFTDDGARDIDVHALHQGFLKGMRRRGGQLWNDARVQSLHWDAGASRWQIGLADGRQLQARHVVNAAGAWADELGQMTGPDGRCRCDWPHTQAPQRLHLCDARGHGRPALAGRHRYWRAVVFQARCRPAAGLARQCRCHPPA